MTTPLIRRLTLKNFLSYGPEGVSVDLLPLNVLIGPNGSGTSNLLEALGILRATARDLQAAVRSGGGADEYVWKGSGSEGSASIDVLIEDPGAMMDECPRYYLEFSAVSGRLEISDESIIYVSESANTEFEPLYSFREHMLQGHVNGELVRIAILGIRSDQSVLSLRRDPEIYPEVSGIAERFENIKLFREWNVGRRSKVRRPQPTDLPSDFLLSDGSNLSLVLHELWQRSAQREELIGYLRRFYEPARYLATKLQGGALQLFIEEEDGRLIPSTRLSDGTLRYLCLLAILCHPNPPPVVAIEEPELGLHPDILPTIAELLKKASERTQLFVTTHSDALVSALSDIPECILVCESMPQGTTIERLDPERLRSWLDEYRLGEIWRMGQLGGNRW